MFVPHKLLYDDITSLHAHYAYDPYQYYSEPLQRGSQHRNTTLLLTTPTTSLTPLVHTEMTYSKTSNRERERVIQKPATERENELFKNQQQRER